LENQYAIDAMKYPNPITKERFDKHLKEMLTIIESIYRKGKLVIFSIHPEFGSSTMNKWKIVWHHYL